MGRGKKERGRESQARDRISDQRKPVAILKAATHTYTHTQAHKHGYRERERIREIRVFSMGLIIYRPSFQQHLGCENEHFMHESICIHAKSATTHTLSHVD